MNNLKQIGLAIHNYHDTYPTNVFPSGSIQHSTSPNDEGWAWSTLILPFIEQEGLWNEIAPGTVTVDQAAADTAKLPLLKTPLDAYQCPSHPTTELFTGTTSISGIHPGFSNYVACAGWGFSSNKADIGQFGGGFYANSDTGMRDIEDGTSNVIAIGEDVDNLPADNSVWKGGATWVASNKAGNSDGYWMVMFVMHTNYGGINSIPQSTHARVLTPASYHPGGVQFLFFDGSVHFISETLDMTNDGTAENLVVIDDGRPLGNY